MCVKSIFDTMELTIFSQDSLRHIPLLLLGSCGSPLPLYRMFILVTCHAVKSDTHSQNSWTVSTTKSSYFLP
jgi:hypothetical protein